MRDVALLDYRSMPGNLGAWCLHRAEGDLDHVVMFPRWKDEAAIRSFAGEDMEAAKRYDFDSLFLIEMARRRSFRGGALS